MHSYARVFKGTQNSSWHGTTIQLVQPMPSLAPIQYQHTSQSEHALQVSHNNTDNPSYSLAEHSIKQTHQSPSRKWPEKSSPIPSPMKLTFSPAAKSRRRAHTGTECMKEVSHEAKPILAQIQYSEFVKSHVCLSINDFMMSEMETESLQDLHAELFIYMLQKLAIADTSSEESYFGLQDYFNITRATNTEKSKVTYLEVMDAVSDNKDTQLKLLHELFAKFIKDQTREHLVIEGDQKLYEVLQSLKFEYGKELDWVIPFPGDWHMLSWR